MKKFDDLLKLLRYVSGIRMPKDLRDILTWLSDDICKHL